MEDSVREAKMKRMLLGLMLLMTATAASAEWTFVSDTGGDTDDYIQYVDRATIRKSGNFVKMWDLIDYKTVQTLAGESYLSEKVQNEYDCKEEKTRILAFTRFNRQMGNGKAFYNTSETSMKWRPISPGSIGEALWKIACGKK